MPGLFIRSGKLYRSYLSIIFDGIVKMDLTTQMKIFNNVKHCQAICLKFGDRFFTSLIMLGCEAKVSTCSVIKENLILYCRNFSAFVVAVIN